MSSSPTSCSSRTERNGLLADSSGTARVEVSPVRRDANMKVVGAVAIAVALSATAALAQAEGHEDMEGAKDHPLVERFPGTVIDDAVNRDFEEFDFPIADEGN